MSKRKLPTFATIAGPKAHTMAHLIATIAAVVGGLLAGVTGHLGLFAILTMIAMVGTLGDAIADVVTPRDPSLWRPAAPTMNAKGVRVFHVKHSRALLIGGLASKLAKAVKAERVAKAAWKESKALQTNWAANDRPEWARAYETVIQAADARVLAAVSHTDKLYDAYHCERWRLGLSHD